jgi:hypothetical protein
VAIQEVQEVEMVLRALAEADIAHSRCPAPAVDVCVAFLLRETKFVEAIEVRRNAYMWRTQ